MWTISPFLSCNVLLKQKLCAGQNMRDYFGFLAIVPMIRIASAKLNS
ncbi:MAG: hypothetical protein ACTTJS_05610 [Wolinella sp.]